MVLGRQRISDLIGGGALVVNDGYRAKNAELSTTGIPFARAGNINNGFHFEGADCFPVADIEKVGEKISQPGDVVFTSKGTVGRLDGTTAYNLAEAPSRAKRLVTHGDTIWACVRPNRKSYLYIDRPPENLVVSTGFAVLRPKAVPPAYLYAAILACLLIALWTGRKPTVRTYEMLNYYFAGWADKGELQAHIAGLKEQPPQA